MNGQDFLQERKTKLTSIVRSSIGNTRQSDGFALRILGSASSINVLRDSQFNLDLTSQEVAYGGYPEVACLGFRLSSEELPSKLMIECFLTGIKRLQDRPESALDSFMIDDVALLGVADGLARLSRLNVDIHEADKWLLNIVDRSLSEKQWSYRMRLLCGDLLDGRGRLRTLPKLNSPDELALDIVLRSTWPQMFIDARLISPDDQSALLKTLIIGEAPRVSDLERAAVWFQALDIIVDFSCKSLFPTISDTSQLLANIQPGLKRWVWKEKARRNNTAPSRWQIDDEFDVQSLLWTVLYPVYGSELVDEMYLPSWGNVQPRADLGILKLKLIIEVKIARNPSDFKAIEEQVAGDLGLYFKNTDQFDRMIVFIYDDCDEWHPERYDSLKNALKNRERIEDVIIVRRPGMIPHRNQRNFPQTTIDQIM